MPLGAIYKPVPTHRRILGVLLPYVAAAGLSAAALGLSRALPGSISNPFFVFFFIATGFTAWLFGRPAAVVSVVLNCAAQLYFVLAPTRRWGMKSSDDLMRMFVVAALSLVVAMLLARLRDTQRALLVSQERFQLAHAVARIWAWELDLLSGNVVWSSAPPREHGVREPLQAWLQKVHPEDKERVLATLKSAAENQRSCQTEFRVTADDGETHWIASSSEFYNTARGEQRMIGVNVDITLRKRAEEALEDAAKLQLAGDLAHQLNNPLQGLLHSLYLLQQRVASTDAAQLSDVAQSEAQRVSRLVAEILRLHRKPPRVA
ncbi:MAG TPA: PAS domain-containing protein [Terriglobales bacterium]|nr:PAS domain-containing protein [Terriglobales bacterium]